MELTGYLRSNVKKFPALNKFNNDVEIEIELFKTFLKELEELVDQKYDVFKFCYQK